MSSKALMRTALFGTAFSVASFIAGAAQADDAGPFAKWLGDNAPRCVAVSEFAAVSRTVRLTPEQFEFVRALYVATPPVSKTLPPGDHAVLATADDQAMLALVSDDMSCARFLAPDFIVAMLIQVGAGATGELGDPASFAIER
jgi:hypothetical protein